MRVSTSIAIVSSLLLASLSAGCHSSPSDTESATEAQPRAELAPGRHVFTTADGNRMPYEVAGEGDATVVMVHCWMCERTYWSEQVPVLAERYRTITLDLPGHGEASAERAQWSVAQYGEDVASLLRELDLSNVVLVGHSMGGPVSLRAAALAPDRVRGIVAVDTLHDAEVDTGAQLESFVASFESDFAGTCASFLDSMFPEEGVEEIEEKVRTRGCAEAKKEIAIALMKDFGNIDMETWFREAGVPIRAINSAGMTTQVETNRKYADFDAVLMEGVGHFLHMTRPEEFNPKLLQAIEGLYAGIEA